MRAVCLSQDNVTTLLKKYVCVYIDTQDIHEKKLSPAELDRMADLKAQVLRRIEKEKGRKFLESDHTRHCMRDKIGYIISPDGTLLDYAVTLDIHEPDRLAALLKKWCPTKPLNRTADLTNPNAHHEKGEISLHHVSRILNMTEQEMDVCPLPGVGAFGHTPAEDWVRLNADEQARLVPADKTAKGDTWTVDPTVARRLVYCMRPASHHFRLRVEEVLEARLEARVVAVEDDAFRIALTGGVKIDHPDVCANNDRKEKPRANGSVPRVYGDKGWLASADLMGYLDCRKTTDGRIEIKTLELVGLNGKWTPPDRSITIDYGTFVQMVN